MRAALDLRPYSETDGPDWWLLSDLGARRPARAAAARSRARGRPGGHHAGPGHRSATGATGRWTSAPAAGCRRCTCPGTAGRSPATDLSDRALAFAAANAALNGQQLAAAAGLAAGAGGRRAVRPDRVQPAVHRRARVSPPATAASATGTAAWPATRCAGGWSSELPDRLAEQRHRPAAGELDHPRRRRLAGPGGRLAAARTAWTPGSGSARSPSPASTSRSGCAMPASGRAPSAGSCATTAGWTGSPRSAWSAVGMGLVSIRRTDRASQIVCEDVPQAYQPPIGAAIADWFDRRAWLAGARSAGRPGWSPAAGPGADHPLAARRPPSPAGSRR